VRPKGQGSALPAKAAVIVDDNTAAATHRVTDLAVPVVPVDPHAQCIAGCDVSSRRSPHLITGDDHVDWRAVTRAGAPFGTYIASTPPGCSALL